MQIPLFSYIYELIHLNKFKVTFGNAAAAVFSKNLIFFLLKFNMVCMFWIVLMY